jgi:hypothetical protein
MAVIYDVFPAFNEIEVIRSRIAELSSVPDVVHVALEAPVTHRGDPKPLYLAESGLSDDRLLVVTVDPPVFGDAWATERAQRDACIGVLTDVCRPGDDDLVICTDADEIVRPCRIDEIRSVAESSAYAVMHMRYHFAGRHWYDPHDWVVGSAFLWGKRMPSPSAVRHVRHPHEVHVMDAGWHMSWWGGDRRFAHKLDSFAHTEFANDEWHGKGRSMMSDGFGFHGQSFVPWDGDPDDFPCGLPGEPGDSVDR